MRERSPTGRLVAIRLTDVPAHVLARGRDVACRLEHDEIERLLIGVIADHPERSSRIHWLPASAVARVLGPEALAR